jgi:hypothetical protein
MERNGKVFFVLKRRGKGGWCVVFGVCLGGVDNGEKAIVKIETILEP